MLFSELINGDGGARSYLQDAQKVRFSDADLMGYANDALKEVAVRRPDLFTTMGEVVCTVGETSQSCPANALRLMGVVRIKNGRALREADKGQLDRFNPNWHIDAAGPAVNWMRDAQDPVGFFIYPPAPADQTLVLQYGKVPDTYTLGDAVPIPGYAPSIKYYIAFAAESRDDEAVQAARAQGFFAAFEKSLMASVESKAVTDVRE